MDSEIFFVEHVEKALCLISKKKVAVIKEFKRRKALPKSCVVFHLLAGEKRLQKIERLQKEMTLLQSIFRKMNQESQAW